MEEAALAILGWRKQIEERCDANGHASPGTSDPHTSDIPAANAQSTDMANGTSQQSEVF
jgi:hypothetical protein